jgi:hypothetical protein
MIDFENAFPPVNAIIDRGFFVSVFLWQQMKFSGNFNKRSQFSSWFSREWKSKN